MAVYINNWAVKMPNEPVSNGEIEQVLGVVGGRPSRMRDIILQRNGIKHRYYAIDRQTGAMTHTNARLTAEAIRELLIRSDQSLESIDLLACGTSSPDQFIPNHTAMVQGELQAPPMEIVCTSGVCCSGMTALRYAMNAISSGSASHAIVTGSEVASASLRSAHFQNQLEARADNNPYLSFENEFLRWMLSDGAGAILLSDRRGDGPHALRIDWIDIVSYAGELESCMYAGAIKQQDGGLRGWREAGEPGALLRSGYLNLSQDARVLEKNIIPVAFKQSLRRMIAKYQSKASEIDWLLPHMSSEFFREPIAATMKEVGFDVPLSRWFTNLSEKGNTGSASIFIMLEELASSGRLQTGQKVVCVVPESARFTFAYMQLTVV